MAIVRAILAVLLACAVASPVQARSAHARIAKVTSAVGTMAAVDVALDWPPGATRGTLRLQAARVDAPELGYRFTRVDWRCTLARDGASRWRCAGPVRTAQGAMALDVDLDEHGLSAALTRGRSAIRIRRGDARDATDVDLTAVPLTWLRALAAKAWPSGQIKAGEGDARLTVTTPRDGLRVAGPLALRGVAFDTPDGTIAAENLAANLQLDLLFGPTDRVRVRGRLGGGELLFGSAYLALAGRQAEVTVDAVSRDGGWRVPSFEWRDGGVLQVQGDAAFDADGSLASVHAEAVAADLGALRDPYLSGFLGPAGLADLSMRGGARASLTLDGGVLRAASARLAGVDLDDPKGRFAFHGLDGAVAFSGDAAVDSTLRWSGGRLYGLDFGATALPLRSGDGRIALAAPVDVPMLGGRLHFDHLAVRPPTAAAAASADFGLDVQDLDVGRLAAALGLPAFTGTLSGRIPSARYAAQQLVFDGGLSAGLFGGRLDVSQLAMERPFGVAPTLSADIAFDDLDLMSLTGVLGFGSISGKLDGRIAGLRLVDWQPVAFDARLRTDRHRGVRQRISQRAVQDLSSVGDASFVSSLQSRLIGLFDDFAYSAIGIDCRLADEVCVMDGLGARGANSYTIVQGGGIPWLTVVGINRRVDWPTLVDRLTAVGKGEARPVVE